MPRSSPAPAPSAVAPLGTWPADAPSPASTPVSTASTPPRTQGPLRVGRRAAWVATLLTLLVVTGMQGASAAPSGKPPATTTGVRQAWVQQVSTTPLPVDVAVAAWSRSRSNTTVSLGACTGNHCVTVTLVDTSDCDGQSATVGAIGGCAVPGPDGSCTAQVKSWLLPYPDALRASVEHEVGHCLGLPHNTTDKRSIMSPTISLSSPPSGPDNTDLANLSQVTW